jgi:signal peptidase I
MPRLRLIDRAASRLPPPVRPVVDWLVTLALAVGCVLAFQAEIAKPYRIPTASMEPTLHCAQPSDGCRAERADRVIANRLAFRFRDPERGEIVVFETPPRAATVCPAGGTFVKRIVGLPSEHVELRDGRVLVDGVLLDEWYIRTAAQRGTETRDFGPVPPGEYFVLGDNRTQSCDSRSWGTVPRGNLVGPVALTYWPLDRLS